MRRLLAPAAFAALAGLAAAPAVARPASCTLVVDGKSYIEGACDFDPEKDGSFQIATQDYFARVNIVGKDRGEASWNADPKSTHAQAPLGELRRQGACWTNARVKLCARAPAAAKAGSAPAKSGAASAPAGGKTAQAGGAAKPAASAPGEWATPDVPGASQSCVAAKGGKWEAGVALELRNCRLAADRGFQRKDGVVTTTAGLCVAAGADGALSLAACGADALVWRTTATSVEGKPVTSVDGRCWTIPKLADPDAPFPYPVIAAPCPKTEPLGFFFSKD